VSLGELRMNCEIACSYTVLAGETQGPSAGEEIPVLVLAQDENRWSVRPGLLLVGFPLFLGMLGINGNPAYVGDFNARSASLRSDFDG